MIDRSGQPIEYDPYSASPIIGATTPTVADIMNGNQSKKRKKTPNKTLKKSTIKRSLSATPRASMNIGSSSSATSGRVLPATTVGPSSAGAGGSSSGAQVIYINSINHTFYQSCIRLTPFHPSATILLTQLMSQSQTPPAAPTCSTPAIAFAQPSAMPAHPPSLTVIILAQGDQESFDEMASETSISSGPASPQANTNIPSSSAPDTSIPQPDVSAPPSVQQEIQLK